MSKMKEILDAAENVTPIAEKNGMKIVSFEDASVLANAEGYDPTPDTGTRTYNADGTLARIRKRTSAINEDSYFENRYKTNSKKELMVVTDFRAIREQHLGRVYSKVIPCYVFTRDKETGKLTLDRTTTISDTEFISGYTKKLSVDAMKEVLPLIDNAPTVASGDEMPI